MSLLRSKVLPFVLPLITNKTQLIRSVFIINRTYADTQGKKGDISKSGATNKVLSKVDWRKRLSQEEYHVTREKGTEPPFSGKYYSHHDKGVYICTCCSTELFSSSEKYDSHSGWPSFYDAISTKDKDGYTPVKTKLDNSCGMVRTEVLCRKCDAHLGHVFEDGPKPTGLRYCINSVALKFISKK